MALSVPNASNCRQPRLSRLIRISRRWAGGQGAAQVMINASENQEDFGTNLPAFLQRQNRFDAFAAMYVGDRLIDLLEGIIADKLVER